MALVLGERRNAVHGRGQANPQGAAVVSRSRVAALGKDYGHSLRTAPCCETPQQRWIRNYHIEGLLCLVNEKISRLPENFRNVLLLRDIQQVSTAEAAQELAVSEAVVKTRLHRARQALRKLLEEELVHG